MKKYVAIVDYDMGNLFSVQRACEQVGLSAVITKSGDEIAGATAAILPGVGAFGDAMSNMEKFGLVKAIRDFVKTGKPFMGICLGMQLLFTESEEFGIHKGLDIIKGRVTEFGNKGKDNANIKVPQVGWNSISPGKGAEDKWNNSPLKDVKKGEYMYFVHSFYCIPSDPEVILTVSNYEGTEYCSGVSKDNVFAVQFHPEKSAIEGIKIYKNWAQLFK